ncbi:MAG: hypothetical protein DRP42_06395 [Tenericutes bacterium]|nr:MAG: hypothetical protein DRP42_06395 [Mycoplasmatota bacterium]
MPYKSIAAAKEAGFPIAAESINLTLAQVNKLAELYDAIKKAGNTTNPFAVAWTAWKKLYKKVGDRWVDIKAASIRFGTEQFTAASKPIKGVPAHAAIIEGKLIHIGTKNLNGWGLTTVAAEQIIDMMPGVPIRSCSALDPHECDYQFDNRSHVGYSIRAWIADGWLWASAAITEKDASEKIKDGTWMPLGAGGWSISGIPTDTGSDFDRTGLLDGYIPTGISLVFSPATPAYVGSGFDMVAAAVQKQVPKAWKVLWADGRAVQFFEDENDADYYIASGKGKKWFEFVSKTYSDVLVHDNGQLYRVHPSGTKTKFKSAAITDHRGDNMTEEQPGDGQDPVMYSQEDLDAKIKEALEAQKTEVGEKDAIAAKLAQQKINHDAQVKELPPEIRAEFDATLAEMTPTKDVEMMIAAASARMKSETLESIEKEKLAKEYGDLISGSVVLGAPYKSFGQIDPIKLEGKLSAVRNMSVAAIHELIEEAKLQVAAASPAQSAFDATNISGHAPGANGDIELLADLNELSGRIG